jgi:glycosyltransferase involved in cell wall biosynthesis
VQRRRPGTTALVAGAAPTDEVLALCTGHGWQLCRDFDDVSTVYARGRVAIAPLDHTAGIQIKVLEAAALGVAQVVSPAALAGLAPGFPVHVAATDHEFVDGLIALLDHDADRVELASAAAQHVEERYSAQAWAAAAATAVGRRAA